MSQQCAVYANVINNLPKSREIKVCTIQDEFKDKNVGVVLPHSDDTMTITAIYPIAKEGAMVLPFIATTGKNARILGVANPEDRSSIRNREAEREAEEVFQLSKPQFLSLPFYEEKRRPNREDLRIMAGHLVQQPLDILFLPADGLYKEGHSTHIAVSELALEALKDYPNEVKIFYYDSPWALLKNSDVNAVFPLTPAVMLKRLEGIKCYPSQISRSPYDIFAFCLAELRAAIIPEVIGLDGLFPLGRYLEVYHVEP